MHADAAVHRQDLVAACDEVESLGILRRLGDWKSRDGQNMSKSAFSESNPWTFLEVVSVSIHRRLVAPVGTGNWSLIQ